MNRTDPICVVSKQFADEVSSRCRLCSRWALVLLLAGSVSGPACSALAQEGFPAFAPSVSRTTAGDALPDPLFAGPADTPHRSTPHVPQASPPAVWTAPTEAGWSPTDTLELFLGLEGSKQPHDLGVNANFGGRFHLNWGMPLIPEWGVGWQAGGAINVTDNAVQVFERLGESTNRTQGFGTFGVFIRQESWNAGLAYDLLAHDSYDSFLLGQLRGKAGVVVSEGDEIGLWGAVGVQDDEGTFGGAVGPLPVRLQPIDQLHLYWTRAWENRAETTFWIGVADGHAEGNLALGNLPPQKARFAFGSDLHVPLSRHVALMGAANFITPADTGTVDAFLGFAFYPSGVAHGFRRGQFSPLLPLANSPYFAVDWRG